MVVANVVEYRYAAEGKKTARRTIAGGATGAFGSPSGQPHLKILAGFMLKFHLLAYLKIE